MSRSSSTRRRTRAIAALALLGLLSALPATPATAVLGGRAVTGPGTLDPAFGVGGIVTTAFAGQAVGASALAQHGTDGFVVVGGGLVSGPDFLLARYRTDGTLDQRFGIGGRVITPMPGAMGAGGAEGVAVDAQRRIVVVGTAGLGSGDSIGFAIARYLPDGMLDSGFGSNGIAVVPVGPMGDSGASKVAIQPDGRIVVVGGAKNAASDAVFATIRLRPDGTLDPVFGLGGGTVLTLIPGGDASAYAVALQPDGKIISVGTAVDPISGQEFAVVRLSANGVPDPTFGQGGIVVAQNHSGQGKGGAEAVVLDPQGRIVVAGLGESPDGLGAFGLMRLRPNGTLDPTFGVGGKVLTPFTADSGASSLLLRSNGGIVAVGSAGFPSTVALAGYHADGSLDLGFGICGKTTTAVGPYSSGNGAVFQQGTRILVAGATFNQDLSAGSFLLARYQGYPTAHEGYGPPPTQCPTS